MNVSVIIVSYNTVELTRNCLKSLFEQTKNISFEVIVSDNGSTDGSIEMIKSEFPRVILLENNANLGFGAANNRALKIAKGKYIFYLNSDTVLLNNAVKLFFDYWENAENKEQIGALGGILLDDKLNPIHSGADLPTYRGMIYLQRYFMKWHLLKTVIALLHLGSLYQKKQKETSLTENVSAGEIGYVTGADLFLKNDKNAYFDELFFMYCEETDLELQLHKQGKKHLIIDSPRIIHLTRKISKKFTVEGFSVICMQESFIKYAKKNFNSNALFLRFLIALDRCNPYLWKITTQTKKIYYAPACSSNEAEILYVGFRHPHHSKFGGYDWITGYPNSAYIDIQSEPFGKRILKRGRKISLAVTYAHVYLVHKKYKIIHFFYGDDAAIKKKWCKNTKLVATVHLKFSDFSQGRIEKFRQYDAVICMSSSEAKRMQEQGIRAHFIPHGFNPPQYLYSPLERFGFDSNKVNICFPGMNYRDFDTFKKIALWSEQHSPNIVFHAVGQSQFGQAEQFRAFSNIVVYPYISDDEYYSLLYTCDFCFLPLTFATANNVLLECQSLGTISILPKIAGIEDYADSINNLFYSDFESLISIFKSLEKQMTKSEALIAYSRIFEWQSIYEKLQQLYEAL